MSIPPPGLGGGVARTGPPPGFGASSSGGGAAGSTSGAGTGGGHEPRERSNGGGGGGGAGGGGGRRDAEGGGTAVITRAQIVFLLTTFTEESFEKSATEIRAMASSHGPEMYHHFLRRASIVANPIISTLVQHQQQYNDDPSAPPPSIPTTGQAALVWRLLVGEAVRASRDIALAPHFALCMLTSTPSTSLPLQSFGIFNLPPAMLFTLSAFTLASPGVLSPSTSPQGYEMIRGLLQQTFQPAMELLRSQHQPFWTINTIPGQQNYAADLTLQEARTIILALYPRSPSTSQAASATGGNNATPSRPPTPTNPTAPHASPISSMERAVLLSSLAIKFSSPAIILQTLSALSPGGPPRSPGSIPLEDVLFELGEGLTQDEGTVEAVIGRWWGPYLQDSQSLTEEATRTIHRLYEGFIEGRRVDLHGILKGMSHIDGISWADVVNSFDTPLSAIHTHPVVVNLISVLLVLPSNSSVPPIAGLLPASLDVPVWQNLATEVQLLSALMSYAPDTIPIFTTSNSPSPEAFARIIDPPANDSVWRPEARQAAHEVQGAGIFNCLGLMKVVTTALQQAEEDDAADAREHEERVGTARIAYSIMERSSSLASEMTLVGLERMPASYFSQQLARAELIPCLQKPLPREAERFYDHLLDQYLKGAPGEVTSWHLVWHKMVEINPDGVLDFLERMYEDNEDNIGHILEIATEVGILSTLLNSENVVYAVEIAALAAKRNLIDLEKWLAGGVEMKGHEFLEGVFDFVERKVEQEREHAFHPDPAVSPAYPLDAEIYAIFIRVIRRAPDLSPYDISRFKSMRINILVLNPKLLDLKPGSKGEQGFKVASFPNELAEEIDPWLGSLYRSDITVDEVVDELARRKTSADPKDREYYECVLHSLFEEHRFLKSYPTKEIVITGVLFGALIDTELVNDTASYVATRYILDACKSPPQEPIFQFGISALCVLRRSLVRFPSLCRSLLEIPHMHESYPALINEVHAAITEREELDQQGGVKLAFPALKLPILVEEGDDEFREPEPRDKDRMMFIVNQLAPTNFDSKVRELLDLFEDQYSRWFAHYFIDLRVSLEQQRHETYMQLVDAIKSPVLDRHILWETLRKARDLLNSEATISSSAERNVLKAVALWLGRITLARNLPIRFKELSLKDLLIQGFDNKRLIVAIPFVCNLMRSCADSTVFRLPNPWVAAVLSLLVEFYYFGDLRLNLKFDIEVLFSKLDVQMSAIEPSNLLRTHTPPAEPQAPQPNRFDLEVERAMQELNTGGERFADQQTNDSFRQPQQVRSEQAAAETQAAYLRRVDELIAGLPRYLIFSGEYPIFTAPTTKRIVNHSIDRAVREIVQAVVDRSCTIAGIATRDLVQKDFGTEGDPLKMRAAAHTVGSGLAGNLALVTCKEPLRTSMTTNIRNMLSQNGFTEDNMPEPQIAGVVNDNLDAACKVITTAAMEKAVKDIDVNLAPQYNARKAHLDRRDPQPFWDAQSFGVRMANSALPDPLRLRSGGLSQEQLKVYEDFPESTRLYAGVPGAIHGGSVAGDRGDYYNGPDNLMPDGVSSIKRGPSPRNLFPPDLADQAAETIGMSASPRPVPPHTIIERFQDLVAEIEKSLAKSQGLTIASMPNHIRGLIHDIVNMAAISGNREQTTLIISQKIVQLLFKTNIPLGREVYVLILQQLCDLAPKVDAEVKNWLVYADDPRKLNVPVTVLLIRQQFINPSDLDGRLAQMLRSYAPEVMDFVAELVLECSFTAPVMVPREAFTQSLTNLLKTQMLGRATPLVESILMEFRSGKTRSREQRPQTPVPAPVPSPFNGGSDGNGALVPAGTDDNAASTINQEKLSHYFLEWVRAFSTAKSPEAAFVPYITYLQKEGILNGEDISSAFYRTAINCAVDLDATKLNEADPKFYGTDALAKLIVLIVKNYGDKSSAGSAASGGAGSGSSSSRAVYYYNKIITIMSYSLVQRQLEMGEAFVQRPWTRFFTSMLSELSVLEISMHETYMGCLKSFANDLGITQPTYAPRFAFGWLSIVSHRLFMAKLLATQNRDEGWPEFHRALMWLLRFLSPFLRSGEMTPASRSIYRATLRLLLVLMHDFPEFLVEYYHTLSTAIPTHCVQLRNIVLSAFPSVEAPLPSCYARLDALQDKMQHIPVIRSDYVSTLASGGLKAAMDQYVRTGSPAPGAIVAELKNRIAIKTMGPDGTTSVSWDHTLLHATVFYLGTSCMQRVHDMIGVCEFDAQAPEVTLLTNLAFALDSEGQYYMLSVVADQLRYPSAHTLFFASFLLFLFGTSTHTDVGQAIPERIARVLLERVIVSKPHPWGLILAFVELLESEQYGFWKQPFVRAEDEVYMMFVRAQQSFSPSAAAAAPGGNGAGRAEIIGQW